METRDFAFYKKSADYVKGIIGCEPDVGIILGSSGEGFAGLLEDRVEISYNDIPNFLRTTVSYMSGKLVFGSLEGKKVLCMLGRFHSYEGYSFEQLDIPVRMFKLLGTKALILTNAAGGVNTDYKPGDVMIITDQIAFSGTSPMRGPNIPEFGPRFFDASHLYAPELIAIAERVAENSPLTVQKGVYFWMPGPQFETPAEIRAIRTLGGDAVGMSTVTEALTAGHCGLPVLGLSLIANMAAGILDQPLSGEEVTECSMRVEKDFNEYIKNIIKMM